MVCPRTLWCSLDDGGLCRYQERGVGSESTDQAGNAQLETEGTKQVKHFLNEHSIRGNAREPTCAQIDRACDLILTGADEAEMRASFPCCSEHTLAMLWACGLTAQVIEDLNIQEDAAITLRSETIK
jgi:hypothetical protein